MTRIEAGASRGSSAFRSMPEARATGGQSPLHQREGSPIDLQEESGRPGEHRVVLQPVPAQQSVARKCSMIRRFRYRAEDHKRLPHVVKFSGGRSSAMLLFLLLENGLLRPDRGDVVIFNNTSCEHPETYRFAAKCKEIVETHYTIPFFWIEFQTYEDVGNPGGGGAYWTRLSSYRLVNSKPWSHNNPNGYRWRGEVFEELLSHSGFVPNQFRRICTKSLKLETTRNFPR